MFVVDSFEEANKIVKKHEVENTLKFSTYYAKAEFGKTGGVY